MKKYLALLLTAALAIGPISGFAQQRSNSDLSRVAGVFVASNYANWRASVVAGINAAATAALTVTNPPAMPDGRTIIPYFVGEHVNVDGDTQVLTAVAAVTCPNNAVPSAGCSQITAAWAAAHPGAVNDVSTGTGGLEEAIQDAFQSGGGQVVIDQAWTGTNANITASLVFASVTIADMRNAETVYWRPVQNATTLATPAVLTTQAACDATHTTCSDATAVGTWTAAAYYFCVSYVDVMGNEGTCSTTANFTAVVNKAVDVAAPVASTGAVGYKIYGGVSYAAATEVPLSSSVCVLTTIETTTKACKVANTAYGQTASNAQVATLTVTTSKLALNATTTSSTTDYVGNPDAVTVYTYAPSARVGVPGFLSSISYFPVGAAAASTVPNVIGTIALPAGYMNFVGKSIRVCGYATEASAGSTATISNMQLWWDANGSDTATGVPILVGTNPMTNTLVTNKTDQFYFCYDLRTTVAGASATAGSIIQDTAIYQNQYTSSSVATVPLTVLGQGPAAVGSLNLAGEARLHIVWLHTTNTDGAGVQLQRVTIQDIS